MALWQVHSGGCGYGSYVAKLGKGTKSQNHPNATDDQCYTHMQVCIMAACQDSAVSRYSSYMTEAGKRTRPSAELTNPHMDTFCWVAMLQGNGRKTPVVLSLIATSRGGHYLMEN